MWDVHRHRVAPEIHQALTEYFVKGDAEVVSAHLVGLSTSKDGKVLAKLDLGKETRKQEFDYVVNCTGPNNCEYLCNMLRPDADSESRRISNATTIDRSFNRLHRPSQNLLKALRED